MDDAEVGVIKQVYQVVLSSLLQCLDCMHLEVQVMSSMFLHNLIHQAHKRLLADEELGAPLIQTYLAESYNPWPVPSEPLQPTLLKFFVGVFSPVVGLMWPIIPFEVKGPTSSTILTKSHVIEDPQWHPIHLQVPQLPLPPHQFFGWGRCASWRCLRLGTPPSAQPWHHLSTCHLKWSSDQSEFVAGLLKLHTVLLFSY